MNSVVPATSALLSRLPACVPGGLLLMRPAAAAGATPMLPKKGCSGMTIPGANAAVIDFLSSGMMRRRPGVRAGGSCRARTRCSRYNRRGSRGRSTRMFTSSASPGSAPSTNTGPVRMCPPGPRRALRHLGTIAFNDSGSVARHAGAGQDLRSVGQQRVDVDDVARGDAQDRRAGGVIPARRRPSTASLRAGGRPAPAAQGGTRRCRRSRRMPAVCSILRTALLFAALRAKAPRI